MYERSSASLSIVGALALLAIGSFLFQSVDRPVHAAGTLGWTELPSTQLQNVCPPNTASYAFSSFCFQAIKAWSGGIADTSRNRLLIWGGGHVDYYGNEIYALSLGDHAMVRLNNPGPVADPNAGRSEERRVGKECRSRWSPYS